MAAGVSPCKSTLLKDILISKGRQRNKDSVIPALHAGMTETEHVLRID
ncbi:MAG: hypothetical protein ACXWTL_04430 [Methylobacter sp.]